MAKAQPSNHDEIAFYFGLVPSNYLELLNPLKTLSIVSFTPDITIGIVAQVKLKHLLAND